jgi:hypothetical protein
LATFAGCTGTGPSPSADPALSQLIKKIKLVITNKETSKSSNSEVKEKEVLYRKLFSV